MSAQQCRKHFLKLMSKNKHQEVLDLLQGLDAAKVKEYLKGFREGFWEGLQHWFKEEFKDTDGEFRKGFKEGLDTVDVEKTIKSPDSDDSASDSKDETLTDLSETKNSPNA